MAQHWLTLSGKAVWKVCGPLVRALSKRVHRLERTRTGSIGASQPFRVVLTIAGTDQEVAAWTVGKIHSDNGTIPELVSLAGGRQDTTDGDLDRFVVRFPDTVVAHCVTAV